MSDPIISRLLKNKSKLEFLAEATEPIYEADADDEYAALNSPDDEEEHDDSQAPIQGNPDDYEEEESEDSGESEDDTSEDASDENPTIPSGGGGSHSPMSSEEAPEGEEMPEEESNPEDMTAKSEEYENPLDNQYAVHFTLGDEVNLTVTGSQNSDVKKGTIEGYDPEGFYKVKWSDDSYTNGLTDIALEELVSKKNESCVCGGEEFIQEGKYIVCDCCGRRLSESKEDPLMLADKSRPKGKRMIRSEAHPVSTATKPSIAEAIRNAFKGETLKEDDDPEEDMNAFDNLKSLENEFWTRKNELQADIEELGYIVEEINDEYVVVSSEDDEDNAYLIPIEGTSRSFYLNFDKSRIV